MLFGSATIGVRVMTSTSGPGWGLMQEGISNLADAELPCLILNVQRGEPEAGTTRHGQMDYLSATRGSGHGGYKAIVLAPASVQEPHDFTQLAFHLADKYRNFVVLLSDGIIGQMMETIELRTLDFGPLPEKDWTVRGLKHHKDGKRRASLAAQGLLSAPPYPPYANYLELLQALDRKYQSMREAEQRWEVFHIEDAELILVAYGYTARVSKEAMVEARSRGLRVGLIRPRTLWPFP